MRSVLCMFLFIFQCFTIYEWINLLWHQNITSTLIFTTAFAIHGIFLIILPIQLKICRSNVFFFYFTKQNVRAWKITSVGLRGQAQQSASNRHRKRNLPKPEVFWSCPIIEVVLKSSQSSQENTCAEVSYWKKRLRHRYYSVNLVKFCRVFVNGLWILKHPSRNKFCSLLTWF